jgi:hypothetical protein
MITKSRKGRERNDHSNYEIKKPNEQGKTKMNGKIQHYFQDKGETNDQRREKKLVRMIGKN